MWENSRCSILFHLLVPGGKWQTVIASPVRVGQLLQLPLPQPDARRRCSRRVGGDQQRLACGIRARAPSCCHHRRMACTAKLAVS